MRTCLEVRDITKTFPGVVANDHVNFTVREGEIHAILGENGAGKSTLMKIIYGLYKPDSGSIKLYDQELNFTSPRQAIQAGIGMVHQHFMLIPALTVAENVVLGGEPGKIHYRRRENIEMVRQLAKQYHLDIDPSAKVGDLSVGLQQRVEILKVFYRQAKLLILDEPTAMLTPQEVEELILVMERLRSQGIPIIFISHKLDEVKRVSDQVTVMRAGKTVNTLQTKTSTAQELANLMVGREVVLHVSKPPQEPGESILNVEDVSVVVGRNEKVKGVNFQIQRGEIFGLAGIDGNGQAELIEAITGLLPCKRGRIQFLGKDITSSTVGQRTRAGIAYIPQDRQLDGLVMDFELTENFVLRDFYRAPYARWGQLQKRSIAEHSSQLAEAFDVRPRGIHALAKNLSGGNQQKVILAREVSRNPELLIAAQPTRGLDVGAIQFIHNKLLELRASGKGILLVSLELDEIMSLSDRIGVIHDGRLMAILPGGQATREQLGLLMTGVDLEKEG
ncbi:ABC transporter ATP-binding protein [Desulfosporosinus sp. PR]|uniref:ABC transporter ATP-binding protein n=1 Tax=Candidatus Desulfosporosinus nitrosoreducens TaxID=3401928 RepID=UPI0027E88A6D|nr:ABC transporter ATP-binding protein [Desulfosporosinus sp. PR]MDQ7096019.1 ABC transporter ATP-binding protein [Desulfosporosinus sp. PR]